MSKRRITKACKRRLTLFGTASLTVIIYFCFSLIYNIYIIYDLSKEKKNLENLYIELQEETETLKIDIEKLNDDDYLANYAREHYLYTNAENGEYIIQIDDELLEAIEEDIDNQLNKNYVIIGLSILMVFIFLYIITKGKRNTKKK